MPEQEDTIERLSLDYRNLSERFTKHSNEYNKQYCSIYNVRLQQMTEILVEKVTKKWGSEYPIIQLHKLSESDFEKCIVIGTLFKDQKLKPSLLKQLAESNHVTPQPVVTHFTDESDLLYIEDEVQRYQLIGMNPEKFVTGIICALLSTDLGKGKLMVHDSCFAEMRPQVERPISGEDKFVIFIGGLNLINVEKTLLQLRLFVNFVAGLLGNVNGLEATKVARIVITGNCIRNEAPKSQQTLSLVSKTVVPNDSVQAVKILDAFLYEFCQFIDVDVMPGTYDPSNYILPQKPLHHCMFPKARVYKSLHVVPNPYEFEIDGLRVLGSSGQPVTDVLRFSEIEEGIEVLENCLKWSHLAPTAPDTLGCYPYNELDPFIIKDCPHVLFAGNQKAFDTKIVTGKSYYMVS